MTNLKTKYVENVNKEYFENAVERLIAIADDYYEALNKQLLPKVPRQQLAYLSNSETIKENAYESLQPRMDAIISYGEEKLFHFLMDESKNASNIVLAVEHRERFLKPIEQLKVILKRFVPSQKPKIVGGKGTKQGGHGTTLEDTRLLKPVKPVPAVTPRVLKEKFEIKSTDKFAMPDVATYKELKELDFLFRQTFIQTGIYEKLNTKNATVNYADRKKKSFESEMDVYKTQTKVLSEKENNKIGNTATELITDISTFKNNSSECDLASMEQFYSIHKRFVALKARIKRNANVSDALGVAVEEFFGAPVEQVATNYPQSIACAAMQKNK